MMGLAQTIEPRMSFWSSVCDYEDCLTDPASFNTEHERRRLVDSVKGARAETVLISKRVRQEVNEPPKRYCAECSMAHASRYLFLCRKAGPRGSD